MLKGYIGTQSAYPGVIFASVSRVYPLQIRTYFKPGCNSQVIKYFNPLLISEREQWRNSTPEIFAEIIIEVSCPEDITRPSRQKAMSCYTAAE